MSFTHRLFYYPFPVRHCEDHSDVAIFDILVADFSIEDCHAALAMTGWDILYKLNVILASKNLPGMVYELLVNVFADRYNAL